ncbi:MAG: vitamin B12 dependent-methionine synthase activation domain-containing protein [Oscillospiraceae bacterium]|nr:vitamin B12 dependent-methionine synthase activation domain-containing protein [Oscillospiraceae bacterium]
MEARLTEINKREVLLYLGYRGGEIPADIAEAIDRCSQILLETARPRIVYRQFSLLEDGTLQGTEFRPEGEDVRQLLKDCKQVVLFGATLGAEVEALLLRQQVKNMAEALILDCCGSSAIENVCDNFCTDLQEKVHPLYLTDRFSPGYGDLPFSQQGDFCRILDMSRRIGVSLSPGGLMIPQKSVTALVGIADRPQNRRFRGCAYCSSFETCTYRKERRTCGKI